MCFSSMCGIFRALARGRAGHAVRPFGLHLVWDYPRLPGIGRCQPGSHGKRQQELSSHAQSPGGGSQGIVENCIPVHHRPDLRRIRRHSRRRRLRPREDPHSVAQAIDARRIRCITGQVRQKGTGHRKSPGDRGCRERRGGRAGLTCFANTRACWSRNPQSPCGPARPASRLAGFFMPGADA